MERNLGWTGLIVEMDPAYYTQIVAKRRQAWTINACLSIRKHIDQVKHIFYKVFLTLGNGGGRLAIGWLVVLQAATPAYRQMAKRVCPAIVLRLKSAMDNVINRIETG